MITNILFFLLFTAIGSANLRLSMIVPGTEANIACKTYGDALMCWLCQSFVVFVLAVIVNAVLVVFTPLTFELCAKNGFAKLFIVSVALVINGIVSFICANEDSTKAVESPHIGNPYRFGGRAATAGMIGGVFFAGFSAYMLVFN